MSRLVQSTCPGCKKLLHIPAEWLPQPIRCKHCGMVLRLKQSAVPPPSKKTQGTVAPAAKQVAASAAIAPVAQPVNGSPFADLRGDEQATSSPPSRRRRKKGRGWIMPAFTLALLVVTGFVAYLNWDRIAALIPADEQPVAEKAKDKGAVVEPRPGKQSAKQPAINRTRPGASIFPRRALIISVHDYLFANPVQNGMPGSKANNLNNLINSLNLGWHIPLNQIAHLSDDAGRKYGARAPTKTVIEKTLTNFLDESRPQDHIVVFFIGHAVELGDDAYLAPIEGELDQAKTLIPLKWFYEQLAKCKARQKVLVLDGNRYNRTFGQERPGGDEMGPKLDAMLKTPPAGVQVWSSCIVKQRSYASDDYPMGVFLESLQEALQKGGNGSIQNLGDALPLDRYVSLVNQFMKKDLSRRKLEQVSRLTGKEADSGGAYDAKEPPAANAATCLAPPPAGVETNKMLVESVLEQVGAPPVKVTHELALRYDALPPFSAESLKKYEGDRPNPDSPLRKAVKNARAVLWAIYPGTEPKELSAEVSRMRQRIGVQLNVLKEGYRAPAGGNAEKVFKDRVEGDERKVAMLIRTIENALEELQAKEVTESKGNESKRWKANYDFILARTQLEYAYLFEYQSMLGSIRKEFPPRDAALHGGWKLASQPNLQGDSTGKKSSKAAHKLLDKIIKDNAGSPWEVLAKREKLTNLGLEWQPTR